MGTKDCIVAGNRTRAARVAGEHSTTEPPMRVQNVYSPAGNTTYSEVTGTDGNKRLHRPGIEPGPPAWQASILPLNHRCVSKVSTALQETPHIQRSQEQMGTTSETRV
ncbi:hypothetical protein RB195_012305 [Necator americanus]|uniref:Uncharacterized protein n=1 Tax=Necator americanus TaxID=51031 RepID=A0ABR1D8C6_NECAM